jgi:hypothetical protein
MTDSSGVVSAFDLPGAREIERRLRYPSIPPVVVNPERLSKPETVRQEVVFSRSHGTLPPAVAVQLDNAVVFGNGSVMTEDGRLVTETLRPGDYSMPDEPADTIERTVALLRKPGDVNYGHWLIECLPRISEFRRMFPSSDMSFGFSAGPSGMRQVREDSLAWCRIEGSQLAPLNALPTRVSKLLLISGNSIHSHTHDFDGLLGLAALAKRVPSTDSGHRRIYVKRPEGSRRRMFNEPEVIEVLERNGFDVVSPETLSVNDQVALFSNAKMVVGVSGAALANILFCPPRTRVLTLMPNRGEEYFFWDVASIAALDFNILFGELAGEEMGCHSDFVLDLATLESCLASSLV